MTIRELDVNDWMEEIERGLDYRRQEASEADWAEISNILYARDAAGQVSSGPNLVLSTGDALLSSLNVPSPVYSVEPKTLEDVEKSPVVSAVANGLLEDTGASEEVEHQSWCAYQFGVGILKVGFDSEFGFAPELELGLPGQEIGQTFSQFDRNGKLIEFGGKGPGMPWVKSIMPHDFVVPYGTGWDIRTARWAAHRVLRHIDEVKSDAKYENTKNLQPVMSIEDFQKSYTSVSPSYRLGRMLSGNAKTAAEYCELWEIHDRQTGKLYVIATGHDKFLRNELDAAQIDGELPFLDLCFVQRDKSFWTTSDCKYIRPHQAELTDIHLQGSKQRRGNVARRAADPAMFEDGQLELLGTADVNTVLRVKEGQDPQKAIAVLPIVDNVNLYGDADFTRRAAREHIGLSSNQFGEFDRSSRRSATESNNVAEGSKIRMDRRQKKISTLYVRLAHKLLGVVFTYWRDVKVVPYVGRSGAQEWARYRGEALKGDYRVKVSFHNEADPTPAQAKQQAAAQAQAMASLGMPADQVLKFFIDKLNDPSMKAAFAASVGAGGAGGPGQLGGGGQGAMGGGGGGPAGVPSGQLQGAGAGPAR